MCGANVLLHGCQWNWLVEIRFTSAKSDPLTVGSPSSLDLICQSADGLSGLELCIATQLSLCFPHFHSYYTLITSYLESIDDTILSTFNRKRKDLCGLVLVTHSRQQPLHSVCEAASKTDVGSPSPTTGVRPSSPVARLNFRFPGARASGRSNHVRPSAPRLPAPDPRLPLATWRPFPCPWTVHDTEASTGAPWRGNGPHPRRQSNHHAVCARQDFVREKLEQYALAAALNATHSPLTTPKRHGRVDRGGGPECIVTEDPRRISLAELGILRRNETCVYHWRAPSRGAEAHLPLFVLALQLLRRRSRLVKRRKQIARQHGPEQ